MAANATEFAERIESIPKAIPKTLSIIPEVFRRQITSRAPGRAEMRESHGLSNMKRGGFSLNRQLFFNSIPLYCLN